jgi:hypothetical protein
MIWYPPSLHKRKIARLLSGKEGGVGLRGICAGAADKGRGRTTSLPCGRPVVCESVDGVEIFFFGTALGADPFIGQVGKGGPGGYAVLIISFGGIVHISAGAFHFLHCSSLLKQLKGIMFPADSSTERWREVFVSLSYPIFFSWRRQVKVEEFGKNYPSLW